MIKNIQVILGSIIKIYYVKGTALRINMCHMCCSLLKRFLIWLGTS